MALSKYYIFLNNIKPFKVIDIGSGSNQKQTKAKIIKKGPEEDEQNPTKAFFEAIKEYYPLEIEQVPSLRSEDIQKVIEIYENGKSNELEVINWIKKISNLK